MNSKWKASNPPNPPRPPLSSTSSPSRNSPLSPCKNLHDGLLRRPLQLRTSHYSLLMGMLFLHQIPLSMIRRVRILNLQGASRDPLHTLHRHCRNLALVSGPPPGPLHPVKDRVSGSDRSDPSIRVCGNHELTARCHTEGIRLMGGGVHAQGGVFAEGTCLCGRASGSRAGGAGGLKVWCTRSKTDQGFYGN